MQLASSSRSLDLATIHPIHYISTDSHCRVSTHFQLKYVVFLSIHMLSLRSKIHCDQFSVVYRAVTICFLMPNNDAAKCRLIIFFSRSWGRLGLHLAYFVLFKCVMRLAPCDSHRHCMKRKLLSYAKSKVNGYIDKIWYSQYLVSLFFVYILSDVFFLFTVHLVILKSVS